MKKIIAFYLLFSISMAAYSQADTSTVFITKAGYLKKSRNQKTTAWIMLSGGVVLTNIGVIIAANNFDNELGNIFNGDFAHRDHRTGVSIIVIAGVASMLGSIPFFINAKHNKHKAISVSLKNDFIPGLQYDNIIKRPVAEVSVVLRF